MGDLQRSSTPSESNFSRSPSPKPHVYIPSELTIRIATPEETIQCRKATYAAWGKGKMSLEQYLYRDMVVDQKILSPARRLVTWVLVPRSNTSHPFLSTCETLRRESFLGRAGNPDIEDNIISFGIASVFTPKHNRRNGYARHMLRLIHHVLASPRNLPPFPSDYWGAPPSISPSIAQKYSFGSALFSVLYSDVGDRFYSLCGPAPGFPGWEVRDPWSSIWTVAEAGPVDFQASGTFKWLPMIELDGYLAADRWRILCEDLPDAVLAPSCPSNAVYVTIDPCRNPVIGFLVARYKLMYHPDRQPPEIHWGACAGDKEDSFITWVPEPHDSTLLISRLRCDNYDSFEILIKSALHMAQLLGLRHVELWNGLDWEEGLKHHLPFGGKYERRRQHLPSFAWYGPEPKQNVVWQLNERYAWC